MITMRITINWFSLASVDQSKEKKNTRMMEEQTDQLPLLFRFDVAMSRYCFNQVISSNPLQEVASCIVGEG